MGRDDWCRRTTWTARDQEEFFARNKRSRGADSKAQYMRIQAHTLFETGERALIEAALALLERSLSDYPGAMDRAWALESAGQCCETLGRMDEALDYYRQALDREQEFPGMRSNAGFRLAKLIAELERDDLYGEALAAAEAQGAPVFPWHAYVQNGVRAVRAHHVGNIIDAKMLAETALRAAAVRDTGLSHGRGHLGTVRDTSTRFHEILLRLARTLN